jgi:hypothetical protein
MGAWPRPTSTPAGTAGSRRRARPGRPWCAAHASCESLVQRSKVKERWKARGGRARVHGIDTTGAFIRPPWILTVTGAGHQRPPECSQALALGGYSNMTVDIIYSKDIMHRVLYTYSVASRVASKFICSPLGEIVKPCGGIEGFKQPTQSAATKSVAYGSGGHPTRRVAAEGARDRAHHQFYAPRACIT